MLCVHSSIFEFPKKHHVCLSREHKTFTKNSLSGMQKIAHECSFSEEILLLENANALNVYF